MPCGAGRCRGISIMAQMLVESESARRHGGWPSNSAGRAAAVCGLLLLAVLLVFSPTLHQGFCGYDDYLFVSDEPHVSAGFSWSGVAWAFTNGPLGDWYPLAMLSHMLDCQLYGLRPAGHHVTNVLLHAAAAVSLFLVLWRMTAQRAVPTAAQASGVRAAPAGPSATNTGLWPMRHGGGTVCAASLARRVGGLDRRAARRAEWTVFHAHARSL